MRSTSFFGSRFVRLLLILAIVAIAITGWYYWKGTPESSPPDKPAVAKPGQSGRRFAPMSPVQAAVATQQDVPYYLSGLGTVTAANTVTVRSRVDGDLLALHFTEGQQVKQGDLLAEIDPRPYQIQLDQAKAQLAKDKAILANARRDLARYQTLAKTNAVARQEVDTQLSLVTQTEAQIQSDEAAIRSAELQLTYSRVTAPISGRAGLRQVDPGNYIGSGDSASIVVLTQTHPIDVLFTLPENEINRLLSAKKNQQTLIVEAWDRTNQTLLTRGELLSLDNQIDATTGTIKLKARFENQDDTLFPNQFVNARIKVDTLKDAVVIPSAALMMGNEGHFVWTVDENNTVHKQPVSAGIQFKQSVVIEKGLTAQQRVVTDGIDRLTEGLKVEVLTPVSADANEADKNRVKSQPSGERRGKHRAEAEKS